MPREVTCQLLLCRVSILARAEARALRNREHTMLDLGKFQSSRAPRRARCGCGRRRQSACACFNPRARRGARVANRECHKAKTAEVSILARAEARALHGSIRPCITWAKFQSSRAPRRARCLIRLSRPLVVDPFQSSRAPRRARCAGGRDPAPLSKRFNPRARRGARVA